MENFNRILLQVWREACQDIEIEKSCAVISKILAEHMPLEQIVLRGLDTKNRQVRTLAVGLPAAENLIPPSSALLTENRWESLIRTLDQIDYGQTSDWDHTSDLISIILPGFEDNDKIIGPLRQNGQVIGFLVLAARPHAPFEQKHRDMCEILLEPFSIALQNDNKLKELKTLREAAEADKTSLLKKLSRDDMGDTIIGADQGLNLVMDRIALVARSDMPVLIFGETGTGKELISRAIHNRSDRTQGPFIRVNCGAIPSELIDSQLFGHEKGAFTGAVETRKGWFERADGGTLFLDEVGEMPQQAQVRLLRILQDGWMERVGAKKANHVDVRVVFATHRDLASMVAQGKFREDLWYRISTFPIFLPPLRDRIQDMKALADHFARRSAIRFGLPVILPDRADIKLLSSYSWPGNIRELGAVLDRAALLGNGKSLEIQQALGWGLSMETSKDPVRILKNRHAIPDQIEPLDTIIKKYIKQTLIQCKGRIEGKDGAAALLAINPHTLRGRMRKLGIQWSDFRNI